MMTYTQAKREAKGDEAKRIVPGTRTGGWYVIEESDRDWHTALTEALFGLSEKEAKNYCLRNVLVNYYGKAK